MPLTQMRHLSSLCFILTRSRPSVALTDPVRSPHVFGPPPSENAASERAARWFPCGRRKAKAKRSARELVASSCS